MKLIFHSPSKRHANFNGADAFILRHLGHKKLRRAGGTVPVFYARMEKGDLIGQGDVYGDELHIVP